MKGSTPVKFKNTLRAFCKYCGMIKVWMAYFKRKSISTKDKPHPGKTKTVTSAEMLEKVHTAILEERRLKLTEIAEIVRRERAHHIIHRVVDMRR